ncbi:phosphotransferase [Lysobacter sp. KIS68-7]|uniref:aminoglycoside phosphotransferase family protein n=1 Tax=Lysobacter sp. KIS68-7 TaxID=2904252 RepID=UPI001E55B259|nr:phosphotransferase [Lysobacter sp. KIS68-7]UHQ19683.1 phosphotransferase [Lysobacter sp. KIS68-7]
MTDTAATPTTLPRETQRLDWARHATHDADLGLARASADAGFRSYWRTTGTEPSRIVMDSPPDKEDVKPWLRIRALLEGNGVRVPHLLAEDTEHGFLLLEDLGPDTYLHVLHADNADALFDDAITQLLRIQATPIPEGMPVYDEALLLRELRLFDEWFLGKHLAIVPDVHDEQTLERVHRVLIDAALAQPQVFVHRDFMPRNLMPAADGPAVLDFQDAVKGPIAYDPLCLFKDAFVSWPQARIDAWLDRYHARAVDAGLPVPPLERFRRDVDLIGVHRHLKVIGIFARLHHRDNKQHYLEDAPRFFAYLDHVLPKYPELAPLAELIERRVKPTLVEYAHWTDGTGDE